MVGGIAIMKNEKLMMNVLCTVLLSSVILTEVLLVVQGRWREAIPLHLCSVSAIAALLFAFSFKQFFLDFLWYLGMPGAALALLFPAPASSIFQPLLNASYYVTHVLILLIPICRISLGMRPQKGKALQMMLLLLGLAVLAAAANKALGTDFLFLASPPAGSPLEAVFRFGDEMYLLTLFVLMLLCCMGMDAAAGSVCLKPAK